jgi:hypothetical protein
MKIPYSSRIINSEHLFLKNLARSRVCSGEFAVVTSLVTDVTLCDFCRAGKRPCQNNRGCWMCNPSCGPDSPVEISGYNVHSKLVGFKAR